MSLEMIKFNLITFFDLKYYRWLFPSSSRFGRDWIGCLNWRIRLSDCVNMIRAQKGRDSIKRKQTKTCYRDCSLAFGDSCDRTNHCETLKQLLGTVNIIIIGTRHSETYFLFRKTYNSTKNKLLTLKFFIIYIRYIQLTFILYNTIIL